MNAVAGNGRRERNPYVSTSFSLYVEEEWADAGRDGTGRLNLSRETQFLGANGDGEIFIFLVQLTTTRISNRTD